MNVVEVFPLSPEKRQNHFAHPIQWINVLGHSSELKHDFKPKNLTESIARWVYARRTMAYENRNIEFMAVRLFDEICELLDEDERMGTFFDREAYEKEVLDILFFIVSTIANQPHNLLEDIDLVSLSTALNGAGASSNVYDKMKEIALNMPESLDLKKDLKHLVAYWFSYVRHSRMKRSPVVILHDVLKKNSGNYPEEYLSDIHPKTGLKLSPDQMELRFDHSRKCLRMLRVFYGLPKDGLTKEQHEPFRELILDFEHAQKNQLIMLELLSMMNMPEQDELLLRKYLVANNLKFETFQGTMKKAGVKETSISAVRVNN